jgi:hypothetical protein
MRTLTTLGLAALVAAVALVAAAPAVASDDDDIIRRGSCSCSTDWKLKLDLYDGRVETEFEVDQNRNGQRWRVVLKRDGNRFFKGVRTTHGPSGSFEVERKTRNPAGSDRIKARAVNLKSGEVCKGAATI